MEELFHLAIRFIYSSRSPFLSLSLSLNALALVNASEKTLEEATREKRTQRAA